MEAAEQQEKAAAEAAQAAAAVSFEAEAQAEKLNGVVKQLQVLCCFQMEYSNDNNNNSINNDNNVNNDHIIIMVIQMNCDSSF